MQTLCVFDLDGTLVDSVGGITASLNYSLAALGCPLVTISDCMSMIGNGARVLCERALPYNKKYLLNQLYALYCEYYLAHCLDETALYSGITDMLTTLRAADISLALLSNKPDDATQFIVDALFPADSFSLVLGHSDRFPRKPQPDALLHIIETLRFTPTQTVHIGDSPGDIAAARAAGTVAVSVSWGFRPRSMLAEAKPDAIADTPAQLTSILLDLHRSRTLHLP